MNAHNNVERLASAATGDSVTVESLRKTVGKRPIFRQLEEAEKPHFLLRGTILDIVDRTVPESTKGRRSRKVASDGGTLLVVATDKRVFVLIPRPDDIERLDIALDALEMTNAETAPGGNERLVVKTTDSIYRIDTSQSLGGETESASEFLAERRPSSNTDSGESTPLNALERLADLHQSGALSDSEFKKKS